MNPCDALSTKISCKFIVPFSAGSWWWWGGLGGVFTTCTLSTPVHSVGIVRTLPDAQIICCLWKELSDENVYAPRSLHFKRSSTRVRCLCPEYWVSSNRIGFVVLQTWEVADGVLHHYLLPAKVFFLFFGLVQFIVIAVKINGVAGFPVYGSSFIAFPIIAYSDGAIVLWSVSNRFNP